MATACIGGPTPQPTPNPFGDLADQSNQAFQQGLDAFDQGDYQSALTDFQQAKLLSPNADPRIDEMIQRTRDALSPSPTPALVGPSPSPIALSTAPPDSDLAASYFGLVYLTVVPGRNIIPASTNQFFYEDQIGLYLQALDQKLFLPFEFRIFNLDTGDLVADVVSTGQAGNVGTPGTTPAAVATLPATATVQSVAPPTALIPPGGPAPPAATPTPLNGFGPVLFWNNFVWYHRGGDPVGRYRLELYATGKLTNSFDYFVGNTPTPLNPAPVPTEPGLPLPPTLTAGETPGAEGIPGLGSDGTGAVGGISGNGANGTPAAGQAVEPKPPILPPSLPNLGGVTGSTTSGGASSGAPAAPPPPPTPTPLPTSTPTPAPALTSQIGGFVAGMDVNEASNTVYIADATGEVWLTGGGHPTLGRPFNISRQPTDLAVDQNTGYLWIGARNNPAVVIVSGTTGQQLGVLYLPAAPGDIQIDSSRRLLFVSLPEKQSLAIVNLDSRTILRTVTSLDQVTGMAVDSSTHQLYLSQLAGVVSTLDPASGQIQNRVKASAVGLSGVATANGLVFAINSASGELDIISTADHSVTAYPLGDEPAAVAAGTSSGTVYVLASHQDVIMRIDPSTGQEVGRVTLANRSGRLGQPAPQTNPQAYRSRLLLDPVDETLYVSQPESGSLSIVPQSEFPFFSPDGD